MAASARAPLLPGEGGAAGGGGDGGARRRVYAGAGGDGVDDGVLIPAADDASSSVSPSGGPAPPYPRAAMAALLTAQVFSSVTYAAFNAVLVMYFGQWLNVGSGLATAAVSAFAWVNMCAGAVLAGVFNDYLFGNFRTQAVSYALWAVGVGLMFITTQPEIVEDVLGGRDSRLTLGIALVSVLGFQGIGYGMANILQNVMVADQFHGHPSEVLDSSFSTFYFFSNVGMFIGEFSGPVLRAYLGWQATSLLLLVTIVVSGVVFVWGGRVYRKVPPQIRRPEVRERMRRSGKSFGALMWSEAWGSAKQVAPVLAMFLPLVVFWALFYQQNSTWVLQAKRMDRYLFTTSLLKEHHGRVTVPPDLMPSLEDVFCLLFIFVFDKGLFPLLRRRFGVLTTPLRKIGTGILCICISFALSGVVELEIERRLAADGGQLSVLWQVPQIFFMGCAEILVAIAGLDFAYTETPEAAHGVVNAVWGLVQAAGQVLTIAVFTSVKVTPSNTAVIFFAFAAACALTLAVFVIMARAYRYANEELGGNGDAAFGGTSRLPRYPSDYRKKFDGPGEHDGGPRVAVLGNADDAGDAVVDVYAQDVGALHFAPGERPLRHTGAINVEPATDARRAQAQWDRRQARSDPRLNEGFVDDGAFVAGTPPPPRGTTAGADDGQQPSAYDSGRYSLSWADPAPLYAPPMPRRAPRAGTSLPRGYDIGTTPPGTGPASRRPATFVEGVTGRGGAAGGAANSSQPSFDDERDYAATPPSSHRG